MFNCSRRQLLFALGAAGAALRPGRQAWAAEDPWAALPDLLKRIQPPKFPARDFEIIRHGAEPDGRTDCTDAFRRAIAEASQAGGGRVVVPEGIFLTGAIHLKSNVSLHVARGATIRFTTEPKQFPIVLTRFEGLECMNYSPLIYAFEQRNIAVTGEGTLDGAAGPEHWWPWKGRGASSPDRDQRKARAALGEMAEKGVPVERRVFGDGGFLRPMFIEPYRSANVLIEDVTIVNSPMYEIHPVLCRNVTVRNVNISSHGPNNDGCDPESSADVLIDGCTFDTGDDCVAIKSGRNADGRRLHTPSENIVVQNCAMKDGHGGVTMGSECSGGIRYVYARNCKMDSPHLDRILRFKNNAMRGGVIEHVYMHDIEAGQVAGPAIEIDFQYEEGPNGPFTPVVRDVDVQNVTCKVAAQGLSLRGYQNAPIRDIRIRHLRVEKVSKPNVVENVEGLVTEDLKIG